MLNNYEELMAGVAATTTSGAIDLDNHRSFSFMVTSAGVASGTGTVTVDASNDGVNWVTGIAFILATSTTPATRVTSMATSGNNSAVMGYIGGDFSAKFVRIVLTYLTDGNYTVAIFSSKQIR